jgi:hypothetical protein
VPEVGEVGIVLAPPANESDGLLAWATVKVGPLLLAGLAVRRRTDGEITVTFPARRDQRGTLHRQVTVLDPALDRLIRASVIAEYVEAARKAGRGPR